MSRFARVRAIRGFFTEYSRSFLASYHVMTRSYASTRAMKVTTGIRGEGVRRGSPSIFGSETGHFGEVGKRTRATTRVITKPSQSGSRGGQERVGSPNGCFVGDTIATCYCRDCQVLQYSNNASPSYRCYNISRVFYRGVLV